MRIKKRYLIKYIFILFFFFYFSASIYSNSELLKKANEFEKKNNYKKAYQLYREWLRDYSEEYLFSVLKKLAKIETNPKVLIFYLESYEKKLNDQKEKSQILHLLGELYQLLSHYEKAASLFIQSANLISGEEKNSKILLALNIFYQLGYYSELEMYLKKLRTKKLDIRTKISIFQLKLLNIQNRNKDIEEKLEKGMEAFKKSKYFPEFLLFIFEYYYFSLNKQKAQNIYDILKNNYSKSIEFLFAQQIFNEKKSLKFHYNFVPADMITMKKWAPTDAEGVMLESEKELKTDKKEKEVKNQNKKNSALIPYIQIGSYLDKENASEQIKLLKKSGFNGKIVIKIINNQNYYRVLSAIPEEYTDIKIYQNILLKKGFPGYIIFIEN